jgi:hypothetical protein
LILLAVAALSLPATSVAQSRMYRWVDDKGVVHYGDTVPPQFANRDRDVLNQQAISVGFEEGEVTPEERAEIERLETEADGAARAKAEIARRDRMLLQTYLSVADIEDLRDRRLELLESQIKVTELYLSNLRKRFTGLQQEASRFKPYSTDAAARQIPENLALDLSRTEASISLYEQTLARTRNDQQNLKAAFDEDIVRFKQLKGG